jgi:hypothetical protein
MNETRGDQANASLFAALFAPFPEAEAEPSIDVRSAIYVFIRFS